MFNYGDFKFREDSDSPDYYLWQVFSDWQRGKNLLIEPYKITSPQMTILTTIYWLIQNKRDTIQVAVADTAKMDKMTTSTVLRTLQKKRTHNPNRTYKGHSGQSSSPYRKRHRNNG